MEELTKVQSFLKDLINIFVPLKDIGNGELLGVVDINPSTCGSVAPIFKSIKLTVRVIPFDFTEAGGRKGHKLFLNYRYDHPTGGNGYGVSYYSFDNCATFLTDEQAHER